MEMNYGNTHMFRLTEIRVLCEVDKNSLAGKCKGTECVGRHKHYMSSRMGKPTLWLGENKGADQLHGNCETDQRLCFRYTDSTVPLLSKSKISILLPPSVTVQPGCVVPERNPN